MKIYEKIISFMTFKDSLENRLKREGYVEGIVENNKTLL